MNKFYHILKTLFLFGWSLFVVFPFLWALTTSFKDANAITSGATYIPWVDYEPSTQGWTSLFTTGSQGINIVGPFIDSAAVTLIASLVSLALGTLAAYGLSRNIGWVLLKIPTSRFSLSPNGSCRPSFSRSRSS
jgi:multiple sugar transport system permease protein